MDTLISDNVAKWTPKNQKAFGDLVEYVDRLVDGDFFDIYNMSIDRAVEELNAIYDEIKVNLDTNSVATDENSEIDTDDELDTDMSLLRVISDIAFALHWHNLNLRLDDKFHFRVVNETNW